MIEQFAGKKIVIIGLGLIGGSLARALVAAGCDCEIVGVGREANILQQAIEDGSISAFTLDVQTACADADLIVVAVPVLSVEAMLREIAPVLAPHAVITDVASVKHCVVEDARKVFGSVPANFVPGHPIAGSEQSGYPASKADLFNNRKVILTPLDDTAPEAVALVDALWRITGAEVLRMTVAHHDEVLAATSHLPHLLAFALVDTLSQQGESEEIFRYAAGGFRDFTRIASSDPVMWRDIFVTNGEATVKILDKYMADLQTLREVLLAGDADKLHTIFKRARKSRDAFLAMNKPRPSSSTD
ncbi:MAG: prephenate dehydrogenase/arogenate dehydrogenase family protein, partial [Pseudomonadota bacterium]|nr:prephenate dehydrogenase/arogenate dehydrogenase family protein [Pseudomonadota bacterium]